jgi:hypothetical protein
MTRKAYNKHATQVNTSSFPDDNSSAIGSNEWNANPDQGGMLGFTIVTKTIASGALTPVDSANKVTGEGSANDNLDFITYGSANDIAEEDVIFLYKNANVITVRHNQGSAPSNSGNIQLLDATSKVLDVNIPLILQRRGNVFYEIINTNPKTVIPNVTQALIISASDEATALTAGTSKTVFRMPYAYTLTAVRASLTTAGTGANLVTIDINEAGSTILSTKITLDASEKTSVTAATQAVISDTSLADDAEITIDIDQIDSGGVSAGLKVYLIGYKT